jgi:hypothetical protein
MPCPLRDKIRCEAAVPHAEVLPGAVTRETPGQLIPGRPVYTIQCVALHHCLSRASLDYLEGPRPLE